jgi:hypothetical protein
MKPIEDFGLSVQTRYGRRPICRTCSSAKARAWSKANPDKFRRNQRRSVLKRQYGMTPEGFDDMLAAQGGRCAVCRTADPRGRHGSWHVDHCHETGRIRGLLCGRCNRAIGFFGDDRSLLLAAAEYLS